MDFRKALTFIFEDKDWPKKVLIGILFSLGGFLIIPGFVAGGYAVEVSQKVNNEEIGLPQWDRFKEKLFKGLTVFLMSVIYALPFVLPLMLINRMVFEWGVIFAVAVIHPIVIAQYISYGTVSKVYKKLGIVFRDHFSKILIVFLFSFVISIIARITGQFLLIQLPKELFLNSSTELLL